MVNMGHWISESRLDKAKTIRSDLIKVEKPFIVPCGKSDGGERVRVRMGSDVSHQISLF